MDWHFLTVGIGDTQHEEAAHRLFREASKSSYFKSVNIENNSSLQAHHNLFSDEHRDFYSSKKNSRGFGNFVWKPYLVQFWLKQIPEGDGLLYLDAGCGLNLKHKKARLRMSEYLILAQANGSLLTQLVNGQFGIADFSENRWTHPALFELLKIEKNAQESNQIQAGILFLVNNSRNRMILDKWFEIATREDYKYLKSINFKSPSGELLENRHDQSIFSCLAKQNNLFTIPDETYFYPNWKSEGKEFPIWAMRNRSGINLVSFKPRQTKAHLKLLSQRIHRKLKA
jgi:hypothetical protein